MPVTPDSPGPYAPPSAIINIVDRFRNKGLPAPIDAEKLGRSGVSDSLIPRTLQALGALDLIDGDGRPTDILEGLRLAPEAEFQDRMADWLRSAYSDALQYIDPDADEIEIRDAFRSYNPVGQQPRMVSLFTGLMTEAGLREKTEKKPPVRKPSTSTAKRRPISHSNNTQTKPPQQSGGVSGLPPALAGLLQSLPPEGNGWSQTKRDQFLQTFGAVLDFCVPIKPDTDSGNNNEHEESENEET